MVERCSYSDINVYNAFNHTAKVHGAELIQMGLTYPYPNPNSNPNPYSLTAGRLRQNING